MRRISCFLIFITLAFSSYAEDVSHHTRSWNSFYTSGPITKDKQFLYFLESGVRFVDKEEKFDLIYYEGAIGKKFLPNVVLWLGTDWETSNSDNDDSNTLIILQQISWEIFATPQFRLLDRTRLEESYQFSQSGVALRFRERLRLEIPIGKSNRYFLDLFDEIFLNLNHPDWVSNKTVSQNRLYIAFKYMLNPETVYFIGYIKRWTFSETDEMSNVISLRVEYNI